MKQFLFSMSLLSAVSAASAGVDLTLYQQDIALISEQRNVNLQAGQQEITLNGVPATLKPQTLQIQANDVSLLESRLLSDLLTPDSLLNRYVGKTIQLYRATPDGKEISHEAQLLAAEGLTAIVLHNNQVEAISMNSGVSAWQMRFPGIPSGLRAEPGLSAVLAAKNAGETPLRLTYLASGLQWSTDYVLAIQDEQHIGLTAWATLQNNSGVAYQEANVRLVAGDIQRADSPEAPMYAMRPMKAMMAMDGGAPAPQAAGDYYVYPLTRPLTLLNGESKQALLMPTQVLDMKREYRITPESRWQYLRGEETTNADIVIQFKNDTQMPLPTGVVRMYDQFENKALLLGEDRLPASPRDEMINLKAGRAFDISAKKKVLTHKNTPILNKEGVAVRNIYEERRRITIKNAKNTNISVVIEEVIPENAQILDSFGGISRAEAGKIRWIAQISAGKSQDFDYRLKWE